MKITAPHFKLSRISIASWWAIALLLSLLATAAVSAYAVILFIGSVHADAIQGDAAMQVESISREALRETIEAFEARVRRFEALGGNVSVRSASFAPSSVATTTVQQ